MFLIDYAVPLFIIVVVALWLRRKKPVEAELSIDEQLNAVVNPILQAMNQVKNTNPNGLVSVTSYYPSEIGQYVIRVSFVERQNGSSRQDLIYAITINTSEERIFVEMVKSGTEEFFTTRPEDVQRVCDLLTYLVKNYKPVRVVSK